MEEASPYRLPEAPDRDSRAWLDDLRAGGPRAATARQRLHQLLLRAARFELSRRAGSGLGGDELEDLANQAADDAMVSILAKLDSYRGESRFTTWAYKFALLEAAVKLRRRAWRQREIPLPPEHWSTIAEPSGSPGQAAETRAVLAAIAEAMTSKLTDRQRQALVATVLNEVPIDVLAERLGTSRGAVYKTIHDARKKLRSHLREIGLDPTGEEVSR